MSLKIVQSPKGYAPFFGRMPGTNNQKPTANFGILPKKSSAGSKIYRLRSVINWMILAFLVSFFEGIEIFFFHLKFFQKKIKNHLSLVLMGCLKLEYYEDNRVRTCVPMRSCEANGSRGVWKSEVDIEYLPFGEVFLEEKNSKWNTPYLFTSKELDRETGMSYFSARYQDPKLGIFLGVDILAEEFPGVSSYAYCLNNPLRFVDPDGRGPFDWFVNNVTGAVVHVEGQSKLTQDTANKIGAGDAENYDRLGADDMFGNENEKANKIRELGASRIENPENFMNRQGYTIAEKVKIEEREFVSGGSFGEENITSTVTDLKQIGTTRITYVKPDQINEKKILRSTEAESAFGSVRSTTYRLVKPVGQENEVTAEYYGNRSTDYATGIKFIDNVAHIVRSIIQSIK